MCLLLLVIARIIGSPNIEIYISLATSALSLSFYIALFLLSSLLF